jgi:hypothetical protein
MASTYSTNLAIELIGTGDQAGAWGNTTNTNLGTLIEQAISGYVTQAVATGTDTSITIPNGASGVARNMFIELTGTGGASTNLIVPSNKKLYFIYNNTSSGQVTVKVAGQTGVSVPNGVKLILVCNGTDVVDATSYINGISANITTLTAGSATITNLRATSAVITSLTLSNPLGVAQGGTGSAAAPSNGQLLVGNGTGFALNTLNGGPGVGITNAAGSITITATGTGFIASVNATTPLQSTGTQSVVISIASSTGSGAVVLADNPTLSSATVTNLNSTSANITTLTGTNFSATSLTLTNALRVAEGGTGVDSTPTNGQLLIGNGSGFALSTLTAGTGISLTNSAGSISISATATTGDIAFNSATISSVNTNQNINLMANGTGSVNVNTTTPYLAGSYAMNVFGSSTGKIYGLLVKSVQQPRECVSFWNEASTGDNLFAVFFTESTFDVRGSITYNRGAGQIAYNTTSDRRAKTIYGPVTNSGQIVDNLKVYTGKMNWGAIQYPMMIADEAQQVTPYCVTGQPNAVDDKGKPIYQQMDYSALVPLLIAEVQSLRARVAALEAGN